MLETIKILIKNELRRSNASEVTIALPNDVAITTEDEAMELIEDILEELYLEGYKVNEDIVEVDKFHIYYHIELY